MIKSLFNIIKWSAIGLATGQIISGYRNKKTFKQQLDSAEGLNKLKVIRDYLLTTNKDLINTSHLNGILKKVKQTASNAQDQIDTQINTLKPKVKNTFDDIMITIHEKLNTIEGELSDFESKSLTYGEETWTEYYRQLASKFALFKKTALKHISQGIFVAEEQFNLQQKIKYIGEKLEELKKTER